ncbi:MAG: hypothetical protein WBK19_10305 [Azonexus sp.]
MNKIDEIALRVADEVFTGNCEDNTEILQFAHTLLAELSKDAEPVGYVAHGSTVTPSERSFADCSIITKEDAEEYMPECITAIFTHPAPVISSKRKPVWQPIDTAPRDNKRLLYLARFGESGNLRELDFDGVWEYWQESYEMPHINGLAWFSASGIEEPTHWAFQDEQLPFTSPPNTADIEQRVAEAIAKLSRNWSAVGGNRIADEIDDGKWREYL